MEPRKPPDARAPGEEKPRRELGGQGNPGHASTSMTRTMYSQMVKSGLNFFLIYFF